MNFKITRRRFTQLVLAGGAAATLQALGGKTFAQQPQQSIMLFGVVRGNVSNPNANASTEPQGTENTGEITNRNNTSASPLWSIVVQSFDAVSLEVKTVLQTAPILKSGEQLSGFVSLKDESLVVAVATIDGTKKVNENTRLMFLNKSLKSQLISGLQEGETILSMTRLQSGEVIALVGKVNGTPPMRIVTVNTETGELASRIQLPADQRFQNLAQCQDGEIYTLTTDFQGNTDLYLVNKGQKIPLSFNNERWNSGFSGLVCSQSNELFALGALRYEFPKYIHAIDKKTGNIKRLKSFDVATITTK